MSGFLLDYYYYIVIIIIIISENNLEAKPGKQSIDFLQKRAILRTSHIVRRGLQSETWKTESWGSPLVQEKYHGEKACNKRKRNNKIIIIIIII
jgi:hypothetical protein